jgi:hypothetical protein
MSPRSRPAFRLAETAGNPPRHSRNYHPRASADQSENRPPGIGKIADYRPLSDSGQLLVSYLAAPNNKPHQKVSKPTIGPDVPTRLGVGSGVLITLQQGGLALGVATHGTLYMAVEPHGVPHAFAGVEAVQIAIVALLSVAVAALPRFTTAGPGNPVPSAKLPIRPMRGL